MEKKEPFANTLSREIGSGAGNPFLKFRSIIHSDEN